MSDPPEPPASPPEAPPAVPEPSPEDIALKAFTDALNAARAAAGHAYATLQTQFERHLWRSHMRRWALEWRSLKNQPQRPTALHRPPWKYSANYAEMHWEAGHGAAVNHHILSSPELQAAVRCRNRSLGRPPI